MYELGGPPPDNLVDGLQFRGVTLGQLPALQGQGISMALVNLDPCTINLPHLHPRATEVSNKYAPVLFARLSLCTVVQVLLVVWRAWGVHRYSTSRQTFYGAVMAVFSWRL